MLEKLKLGEEERIIGMGEGFPRLLGDPDSEWHHRGTVTV